MERERPSDHWHEVHRLFERALDLTAGEREGFLDDACAGEPRLRREVEALLRAADAAGPWMERSAAVVGGLAREAFGSTGPEPGAGDPAEGQRVGAYRIVRVLGRGGMGTIYLAERADGQFRQEVALKLLRRGLDTEDLVRRFLAERQILATLSHPNIARLLDGGVGDDGRPYLVLEYVDGQPITEFCAARGLTIEQRLRLFLEVCRAVAHAHRNLVLHRDLKPSNILVTPDGQVKLLDFGIAKILDPDALPVAAPPTRAGVRLMTPEYASPEQVRGEPVNTASDLYQLGCVLYRLLTGRHPYGGGATARAAIERAVLEEEPTRPSAAVAGDADRLRRRLRGDLDTIVTTALRKEPDRRYRSVEALAADIERHLAHLPIAARPDRWSYYARKFVRRNRVAVSAAAVVLLLVAGSVAALTEQQARTQRERDRAREAAMLAEAEARKAAEVRDFLVTLFRAADPAQVQRDEVTARELLEAGAQRVRTELGADPALKTEMLATIADVYGQLMLPERAEPLAEEALELRLALHDGGHPAVAASLLQLGSILREDPVRADSARAVLRRAVEAARAAHGPRHPHYARALHAYAMSQYDRWSLRAPLHDSALAILRAHPGDVRAQLASTLVESAYGNPDRAVGIRRMQEALEIRRALHGENHTAVAGSLSDLALALEPEDPARAESLLRRAYEIHRGIAGERHATTLKLANNLAGVLRDQGRHAEAEPLYRHVLDVLREDAPDAPVRIAYALYGLGTTLVGQGRADEAEPFIRELLGMGVFPEDDSRLNRSRALLAEALVLQGRFAPAESLLQATWASIAHREGRPDREPVLRGLVRLYEAAGRPGEAQRYRDRLEGVGTGER